ncbi:MAG: nucleoside hydrolase [Verrucomicrobiota bacterium]
MQKVIIDSDWGGDVLQLSSILLARPDTYKILGATVTFGNSVHDQNLRNAGSMLRLLNVDHAVPRFPGARAPSDAEAQPEGDGAHGTTGLGAVEPELSPYPAETKKSVDFILETLAAEPANTVTIIATGPQTNIAKAIQRNRGTMQRAKEIRIMAACTAPISGYRVDKDLNRLSEEPIQRWGNITEYAEFNFQQAPKDAQTVLESGIPVILFPMNCTHQMTFTDARKAKLGAAFKDAGPIKEAVIGLHEAARVIDRQKFEIDPTLHDVHTTVSMVNPACYKGRWGTVSIVTDPEDPKMGYTSFTPDVEGHHWVAEQITQPDLAFEILVDALKRTIRRETALT